MNTDTFKLVLGIASASVATYATAWSIRRRREDRRWWWWMLVGLGAWAYALWYLVH